MKWLIILVLLLVLAAIIAVRFRRQITMGIQIFQMLRQLRSQVKPREKTIEKQADNKNQALVRCARCGTWTPQATALNLRSKIFYCSPKCMEKAVNLNNA